MIRASRMLCMLWRDRQLSVDNCGRLLCRKVRIERKGKEDYLCSVFYILCISQSAQAWITQFYLQIRHACLSFVCVHQMAPPLTEVRDIQLQLTTHLSTSKGWKAELALKPTIRHRVRNFTSPVDWTLFVITVEVKLTCLIWSSNKIPLQNVWSELHLVRLYLSYLHRHFIRITYYNELNKQ